MRWKKAKAIHFASSRSGLDKLHQYLLSFSDDPTAFLILCEPTGGHYGVSLYQDLLKNKYSPMLVDNSTTRHMREKIFGSLPKTDEMDLARNSSGSLPDPGRAWRLAWMSEFLLSNFELLSQLDKQIEHVCSDHPNYPLLMDIPYSGPNTLGTILAITGECTRFRNYRQYVAYTGYFAGLERSQTIDHTRMSRRGNRNLKRAYFQIVAPMVWFDHGDNFYNNLYKRKVAEGRAWYAAMPFACAALARHIYHCLKFQEPYQLEKAFRRVLTSHVEDLAQSKFQADLEGTFEVMDAHLSQKEELQPPLRK